jgi:hypothetical protein
VDHPVVAAGAKEDVASFEALAVEGDHDLVVAELVGLVDAVVPDLHHPGAVGAGGYLAREVDVLERVVLDVDGEVVALWVGRDAFGNGPGDEYAVALEAQVPVQSPRVVLLDHEPGLLARRSRGVAGLRAAGLGGGVRIALRAVGAEAAAVVAHDARTAPGPACRNAPARARPRLPPV